ncbi:aspartate/glutamate racemase family protein [Burkholderia thailandensis]|uniref:aspartate/glutamate racemase family protein n=2 Tax=Burkholderia thailandensis TaxID=57975 RepID=UPI0003144682|nr:aspartate/glutamate racemase family protein [Burkholderia thailandensis]MCS6423849.1 aspartate/glutamate racemase family protein [Burkholderia thailandensis]MCS6463406.1 aspartate/glutamate racemase family protein [Burkholderia thailandensis]
MIVRRPMPAVIACLHTAASNVPLFEQAAAALGFAAGSLTHAVRPDLLAAAERAAETAAAALPEPIAAHTRAAIVALARDADAVVLTCSTLGPSVDALAAHPKSIVRADAALARACARAGERIAVLCAAPSSERPTRALFEREARATGARMEVRIVPDAWARFHAGDAAGYRARLARAADAAYAQGFDVVAFAQASMAIAAPDVTLGPPPLTVPRAALARLLRT